MENTLFYINTVIFVVGIAYALAFGLKNLIIKTIAFFSEYRVVNQSSLGKFFDSLFIISIIYFSTFGFNYIQYLIDNI